ncbi:MAG: tetratricopeptide repeat protein [Pseudomonadales bacterium]|nr:tetratricopeptide repeat protein [Pseudomonadales bacterium]
MTHAGRNDPCPCGSGRKFKHCCAVTPASSTSSLASLENMALQLYARGQIEPAEALCRQLLQMDVKHVQALILLGSMALNAGRFAQAAQWMQQALQGHTPKPGKILLALAMAQQGMGKKELAVDNYLKAIQADADLVDAHFHYAGLMLEQGRMDVAEASYRQILQRQSTHLSAHINLAAVLKRGHRSLEALPYLQKAVDLKPEDAILHRNLGLVCQEQGRLLEAEKSYREALRLCPDDAVAISYLLFCLNYRFDWTPAQRLEEAVYWGRRIIEQVSPPHGFNEMNLYPSRLRVGLVSGDLRRHPVGYFLENLLRSMQHSQLEIFAYYSFDVEDELTKRLRQYCHSWVIIDAMSDEQAAQRIRQDGIHILIDLAGHTPHNRLPLFASRPAPVQITWLGYFATTGLPTMDYILVDKHISPPEEEGHFSEQRFWLPDTYRCFMPPAEDIQVNELPALQSGDLTFGCFNNLSKLNDPVLRLWGQILREMPRARLLLKSWQLGTSAQKDEFMARLTAQGVDSCRVELQASSGYLDYLQSYHEVDIALDPFPYTGGTVSIEGLWMGVPVLTLRGHDMLSRSGENLLQNLNMPEWIAEHEQDYLRRALSWSGRMAELVQLRRNLRHRLLESPLCDGPRFARQWELALCEIWRRFVEKSQRTSPANGEGA